MHDIPSLYFSHIYRAQPALALFLNYYIPSSRLCRSFLVHSFLFLTSLLQVSNMHFTFVAVLLCQVFPVLSFPTVSTHHIDFRRDATIPIVDLSVAKRSKAAEASEAKAGEAAATNQTTAQVLAVAEEFKVGVVRTVGVFGSANPVQGGNLFTKMKLPANVSAHGYCRDGI
jgi:hypothetical protein